MVEHWPGDPLPEAGPGELLVVLRRFSERPPRRTGLAAVSASSLARRLRKREARRRTAELPVRYVWWDAGEPEPVAQPGERLVNYSWDDHPEPPAAAGPSR